MTLVELLIVLFIISLVSGAIVLNLPPRTANTRAEAEMFAAKLVSAGEAAIYSGQIVGLEIRPPSFQFYVYERGVWQPAPNTLVKGGQFHRTVLAEVKVDAPEKRNEPPERQAARLGDAQQEIRPPIRFTPTGETTAMQLRLGDTSGSRNSAYFVELTLDGTVKVHRDE